MSEKNGTANGYRYNGSDYDNAEEVLNQLLEDLSDIGLASIINNDIKINLPEKPSSLPNNELAIISFLHGFIQDVNANRIPDTRVMGWIASAMEEYLNSNGGTHIENCLGLSVKRGNGGNPIAKYNDEKKSEYYFDIIDTLRDQYDISREEAAHMVYEREIMNKNEDCPKGTWLSYKYSKLRKCKTYNKQLFFSFDADNLDDPFIQSFPLHSIPLHIRKKMSRR